MSRLISKKASAGGCVDSDAQAFITAAGISGTEADAICTLVTDLKAASLWGNFLAIYPFVGGTAASHKWNLKDPRDLDAAYRLTFQSTWTHNEYGVVGSSGASSYIRTYLYGDVLSQNSTHLSYFTDTELLQSSTGMGYSNSTTETSVVIYGDDYYANSNNSPAGYAFYGMSSTPGYYMSDRIDASYTRGFKNGTQVTYSSAASTAPQNLEIILGARNDNGTPSYFSTRRMSFVSIGSGFTEAEAATVSTIVHTYNNTLGRGIL